MVVFFYHLAIRLMVPFNPKARLFYSGRKNWLTALCKSVDPQARTIWFHCASLGEFEQGRPVIETLRKAHPEYKLLLTFFSPSGYEIRKNYPLADIICYLPKDTSKNAALFLDTVRPEKVFFVKYEFWFHFLDQIKKREIPLYLVSGIFRKEQRFFGKMPWSGWFRGSLRPFTHFFVQDEASLSLLSSIGFGNCTISGDTRFDRVADIAKSSQPFPIVDKFSDGKQVLIAGSTWKPDEELLVPFMEQYDGMKYIIAPHEVSVQNINRLTRMLKKPAVLFSKADEKDIRDYEILIIDSVGKLSSLYRYGTYAYIGGGFGVGIHNILEATTFGLPVFFGPNYRKFREACQLVDKGAAFPVRSEEEFRRAIFRLTGDPEKLKTTSGKALDYVNSNLGATAQILQKVFR